ncbi:ketoacyl-synthetase C-terminal extension domain-containing protein, partial [Amycolatopsis sp. cmx-4-68]|uniref:ketoacyl-synthetase C-terminal extension domain-containing protein n=1 Tax=Amycolatopsis sp. cmx-4-68 TaxID=2790938 RepID=UPI00397B918C
MSSFGVSGTNAHVILEQAPEVPAVAVPAETPRPWLLSGRTEDALRAQAARLRDFVAANPEVHLSDIGLTLASGPARFAHTAAVVGHDRDGYLDGLEALADGGACAQLVPGPAAATEPSRTAFLFAGQGGQRVGMGGELYRAEPVFADVFDEVCG